MTSAKYDFWNFVKFFFAMLAMLGTLFGIMKFIDSRIEEKIDSTEYMNKIASRIRPSLIFDSNGVILYDLGALEYIEGIEVAPSEDRVAPDKITIEPKHYLSQAPLLTSLDSVWIKTEPKRGKGMKWEYHIIQTGQVGGLDKMRFRIEITSKN